MANRPTVAAIFSIHQGDSEKDKLLHLLKLKGWTFAQLIKGPI